MARILIVDDHDQCRLKLRLLIDSQSDWKVCAEAADGIEAIDKHRKADRHLTVMDFNMPLLDGLKASRQILRERPDAAILMVTVSASDQLAKEAKRVGIRGFCSKKEGESIIRAIETLLRGKTYFSKTTLKVS